MAHNPKHDVNPGTNPAAKGPPRPTGGPVPPPPPPPASKGGLGAGKAFNQFITKHKALKPYADLIWKWSKQYGIDAVELAALIQFESAGKPGARSSANAVGLAQIHLPTWLNEQMPWGETVTEANAKNPAFAVRFAAWYFSQQKQKYGSFDEAYRRGYNPGYTGNRLPSGLLPKGYIPKTGALSPTEQASANVEQAAATQELTDPWVVLRNGKVKFVRGAQPPKGVLTFDGVPVTRSAFLGAKRQLEETFLSYTNKRPTDTQVATVLSKGWSQYTLAKTLAGSKDFVNSPIYKSRAPAYQDAAKGLLGDKEKLDPALVRDAIVNNWGGDTFQAVLRKRDGYVRSNEFKGKVASYSNVYQTIYGTPDEKGMTTIKEVAAQDWSFDQFAGWLRSQPEYTFTPEYRSKALTFAETLGLITGATPVLLPGSRPQNPSPGGFGPPADDPRIQGKAGVRANDNLVAGFQNG